MNLRDLKPSVMRRLATEGEHEFTEWLARTEGKSFSTKEPLPLVDVWRTAFSKGASAVLRRVDKLKED